jgi:hypothetical protein
MNTDDMDKVTLTLTLSAAEADTLRVELARAGFAPR